MERVILHCDLNNFYASVECLYNPQIRDFPVAVCGDAEARHGIVLAKNQIAKGFSVKTGEPIWQARQKCPGLVTVKPNFALYMKFSKLARDIYKEYTDLIESFGIDECWLDVTGSTQIFGSGEKVAYEIKEKIKNELGVTISIGVSFNKIFAKLGSDMKKPNAVTVITREDFKSKIWSLPAEELLYVGHSIKRKLSRVGINTIGDLAGSPIDFLRSQLGKWGETLWLFANGYDSAPVSKVECESIIKGVGNSLTTQRDLEENDEVKALFYVLSDSVGERLRKHNLKGRTVQISIKDTDLIYIERQGQLGEDTFLSSEIAEKAYELFKRNWEWRKNIRALGVRVTNLNGADEYTQMMLFGEKRKKKESVEKCIDEIRTRFGHYSVQRALMLKEKALNVNPIEENVIYPISYFKGGSI